MADNTEEISEDDELLAAFVDESLELLQDLPSSLESYSADSGDTEQINAIFRAVHSIKGNAGFFGLGGIKQFAHSLENTLDEVRGGALVLGEKLTRSLIDGFDILDGLLNQALEGQIAELGSREENLLKDIADITAESNAPVDVQELLVTEVLALADEMANADVPDVDRWVEHLRSLCPETSAKEEESVSEADDATTAVAADESVPRDEEPVGSTRDGDADAKTPGNSPSRARYLRVKEGCVDEFMTDVSRLFITLERLKDLQNRMSGRTDSPALVDELRQVNSAFSTQANALQGSVAALRRVPVRGLFSKFPRVARTLAANLGKKLNVHLSGEELEIDKSLVEDLDAPLMHMIRTVCDHGIETPEERQGRGAPETGNLWMSCELTNEHVILKVRDDGRGIDPGRLRTKSIEKGVLTREHAESLSDEDAVDLVFHAGFSTAEKISGRGVGLDVVRSSLRDHNGDIQVTSKVGEGTLFRLQIPLRKAVVVVDGLLVDQEDSTFILPFEFIREIFELDSDQIGSVQGQKVARIRGEPFAAVSLGELLGSAPPEYAPGTTVRGVLVTFKSTSVCLIVDAVVGQRKVVINDLSNIMERSGMVSGVAQLGGGELALVLNTGELISCARTFAGRAAA